MKSGKIVLSSIIILLFIITQGASQDYKYQVNGLIIDEETQAPLIGATIQDSIAGIGKISDSNG